MAEALIYQQFAEQFWLKVRKSEGCWIWQGIIDKRPDHGYGWFKFGGKWRVRAHRFSWEITYGNIPDGMLICHKCDVRACVRPEHLFLGTSRDNAKDMTKKGRCSGRIVLNPNQTARLATVLGMSVESLLSVIQEIKFVETL